MPDDIRITTTRQKEKTIPLGFGGLTASIGDHIGHFYQTREEWLDLLIPFLKTGLEEGDKCVYVMSREHNREEIQGTLEAQGMDPEKAISTGQLILGEGKETPEAMRDWLEEVIRGITGHFSVIRWGGDMTWSLNKMPTSEAVMVWESMCNIIDGPPAVFFCQYDLGQFLGNVVVDALKTHPLCIIGSGIHKNPFYVNPDVFLEELRNRGTI